jgi:hypothetical protein
MAVYNEIGIGRWNRFIQKLTDMKGGPPARQLSSEIVFSHPIFHGVENRFLESWDLFGVGVTIAAIGGAQSGVRLTNPTTSNVIAVVTKALLSTTAGGVFNFEYGNVGAGLSNALVATPMERRGRSASTCLPTFNVAALSTLNVVAQLNIAGNTSFDFIRGANDEVCLPPGASVQMDGNAVNNAVTASFWWRERFLEPAERF